MSVFQVNLGDKNSNKLKYNSKIIFQKRCSTCYKDKAMLIETFFSLLTKAQFMYIQSGEHQHISINTNISAKIQSIKISIIIIFNSGA
jgi:hypothetical protein